MPEFIIGIPKNQPDLENNLQHYTNVQDAHSSARHAIEITSANKDVAEEKFRELHSRNFISKIAKI